MPNLRERSKSRIPPKAEDFDPDAPLRGGYLDKYLVEVSVSDGVVPLPDWKEIGRATWAQCWFGLNARGELHYHPRDVETDAERDASTITVNLASDRAQLYLSEEQERHLVISAPRCGDGAPATETVLVHHDDEDELTLWSDLIQQFIPRVTPFEFKKR